MSTYHVQTTASISTGEPTLSGVSVGDYIITDGFYAAGDGGGATFEIR